MPSSSTPWRPSVRKDRLRISSHQNHSVHIVWACHNHYSCSWWFPWEMTSTISNISTSFTVITFLSITVNCVKLVFMFLYLFICETCWKQDPPLWRGMCRVSSTSCLPPLRLDWMCQVGELTPNCGGIKDSPTHHCCVCSNTFHPYLLLRHHWSPEFRDFSMRAAQVVR